MNNLLSPTLAVELLKAARSRWYTCEELGAEVNLSVKSARKWVNVWVTYGVLIEKIVVKTTSPWSSARVVTLAPEWGGEAIAKGVTWTPPKSN